MRLGCKQTTQHRMHTTLDLHHSTFFQCKIPKLLITPLTDRNTMTGCNDKESQPLPPLVVASSDEPPSNRGSSTSSQQLDSIPVEMQFRILSYLPAKQIQLFRRVSRHFRQTIDAKVSERCPRPRRAVHELLTRSRIIIACCSVEASRNHWQNSLVSSRDTATSQWSLKTAGRMLCLTPYSTSYLFANSTE